MIPAKQHRQTPLASHVADFENHSKDRGNRADHVQLTIDRVDAAIEFGNFHQTGDVSGNVVERFLGRLVTESRLIGNPVI